MTANRRAGFDPPSSRTRSTPAPRRRAVSSTWMVLAAAATLAGCSTIASGLPPPPPKPDIEAGTGQETEAYRIQVGDVLDIKFLQIADLNEEVTVRPDGHISTTVVEDEVAAGRTVPELAAALKRDYAGVVKAPRLTVIVKSFVPNRVYVGGEVNAPGEFITIPPNLTLAQAIARAGGVKLSGSYSNILIVRRGPRDTPQIFQAQYDRVRDGSDPAADVRLANYDLVYVPRTGVGNLYTYFNQYLQQFVPVSWGFSYLVNPSSSSTNTIAAPSR